MVDGEVTSTTPATGHYTNITYHSVVRSAIEVATTQSVLAIELHFMDTPQTIINFNAWMMVYASSTPSPASPSIYSCYMLPEPSSYLSSFDDNELSMDLNVDTMCALAVCHIVRTCYVCWYTFFFTAEDGIRDIVRARRLCDLYKRQAFSFADLFFFFKQKTGYEMLRSLVGSVMCIRDSPMRVVMGTKLLH